MKKLILTFSIAVAFVFSSQSQISLGGQVGYNRYAGYGIGNVSIGVLGDYAADRFCYRVSLNYFIADKQERTFDLFTGDPFISGGTNGSTYATSINGLEKYSGLGLWLDFHYFFTGDAEDGGFYGTGGLGLNLMTINYELEEYDANVYHTQYDYTEKDRLFQPVIRLGLGYDYQLDFGNIFAEFHGNIPANVVNGASVDINLPFSFGGNVGVRIPLN
jgi:hypothetical protein